MGDPFVRRCRSNRICRENGSLPHLESRNRGNYSAGSGTGKGVLGSRQIIFIEKNADASGHGGSGSDHLERYTEYYKRYGYLCNTQRRDIP